MLVAAISLEYEQPGHGPELLRACGDKHVLLGLLNLASEKVESVDHIARRIESALAVVPADRLHPCSDCGMWHLARDVAFGKISALAAAARRVRGEVQATSTNGDGR
jgi:5-methyltetrahydropteroyltriglutamate--homocysteine methyltransferase